MARFGIICEYNPLHGGHVYHLQCARAAGADGIVCIMSGNFTQRAEPAMAHKYARAEAAISCGADLVIELPFPYSAGSAEFFACGGVAAADAFGCDSLYFGSESGNIDRLKALAAASLSSDFKEQYDALIKTNIGTAAAYAKALSLVAGEDATALSNDLLGIAYCKAILSGGYDVGPLCTKRVGADYNEKNLTEGHPSATALRKIYREEGFDALQAHLPAPSFDALARANAKGELLGDGQAFGTALLAILRTMPTEQIESAALCASGLGARIASAAHHATTLDELYALTSHKSLPDAHVRRAVLYAALGVTEQDLRRTPAYFTVLAANAQGRRILADLRRTCPVPVVIKPADAPDCRQRTLSDRADALYTLAMQKPQSSGFFIRFAPYMA